MPVGNPRVETDLGLSGDARWDLVLRISSSSHLKNSPRLREFLLYVAGCAIRNAPEEATEQQIGMNVFGRPPGYNSSEDSIVRTHARLLRQKLAAYFEEQAGMDELVVEIPKGHYLPVFHARAGGQPAAEPGTAPPGPVGPEEAQSLTRNRAWRSVLMGGVLLLLLALTAIAMWRPWKRQPAALSPVQAFWQPFFTGAPPLVIYSNALFVGNSSRGLRYADPDGGAVRSDGDHYVDTYTGVGELASVHTLTRLFDENHSSFILKRSLLVTWDEAQTRNLIFIGSRAENPSLRVLPPTTEFSMMTGPGYSGIVNHHPLPGEPALFSRPEHPLTRDYAILALLPGVSPGHRVLIFSGLMTFGTQAAADFVCQPATISPLLKRIRRPDGEIRSFEAVLETDIGGEVPLRPHLVALRLR